MSRPKDASAVKAMASIFSVSSDFINHAIIELTGRYGEADFISDLLPFLYTDYYVAEMGSPLWRRFISFEKLIKPETLPDIKLWTNELESSYVMGDKRSVNIDPGYLSPAHLILATGKAYTHRPYLRDGIYVDLTLIYQNKAFQSLPWTYPDYAEPRTKDMFKRMREKYLFQLKGEQDTVDD
jgi:hypothetical protein